MSYDLIVIGSGNGACGFLSKYLESRIAKRQRILVLEEGRRFFEVSDLAHENNWIKSFSESDIFKLRHALTEDGTPIITARGSCQGGGGSINYTMIHEESQWLATHLGRDPDFWSRLKEELNSRFNRAPPANSETPVTRHVVDLARAAGYKVSTDETRNIPNYGLRDGTRLVHRFPTPFNRFGQRTNSGASLVEWDLPNVELRTRTRVKRLEFSSTRDKHAVCSVVHLHDIDLGADTVVRVSEGGLVVMCAGSTTPQLLLPHFDTLGDGAVGRSVSDHVLLPLGLYVLDYDMPVNNRDVYVPVFATCEWEPPEDSTGERTTYGLDFHAGPLKRLWFMLAHLFLAFVFPNWFKRVLVRSELLFRIVSNGIRILLQVLTLLSTVSTAMYNMLQGRPWSTRLNLITATLKFRPSAPGRYVPGTDRIELAWFREDAHGFCQDAEVAKDALVANFALINGLGAKPLWPVRKLLWWLVRMPYTPQQAQQYVDEYRQRFLLSQLHLAGGCDFGAAVQTGDDVALNTGKVVGTENVHVADLSTVPLPRVSPQMTAYLIGYHVASALTSR